MLNLLRKTFEQIILFFYIRTDTLKVVNKNLEEDLDQINQIIFCPEFERSEEEKDFLNLKKREYQWGNYSRWNPIYKNGLKRLQQEYRIIHQNICHLLYD